MTRKERMELNELSIKAFGKSSRWKKFVDKGRVEKLERETEPGYNEEYLGVKYYTVPEVKELMEKEIVRIENERTERERKELEVGNSVVSQVDGGENAPGSREATTD